MSPADPWDRFSHRAVWCETGQHWSPDLTDHHAAADWAESHECRAAAKAA